MVLAAAKEVSGDLAIEEALERNNLDRAETESIATGEDSGEEEEEAAEPKTKYGAVDDAWLLQSIISLSFPEEDLFSVSSPPRNASLGNGNGVNRLW
jgi:hypothetical protein